LVTGCKKAPTAPEGPKTSAHAYSYDVSVGIGGSGPLTLIVVVNSVCQGVANSSATTYTSTWGLGYSWFGNPISPTPDAGTTLLVSANATANSPVTYVGITTFYDGGPFKQVSGSNAVSVDFLVN
jgi:hypothetical protein